MPPFFGQLRDHLRLVRSQVLLLVRILLQVIQPVGLLVPYVKVSILRRIFPVMPDDQLPVPVHAPAILKWVECSANTNEVDRFIGGIGG